MKKRLLSLAMSAVMIFGMIPAFTITTEALLTMPEDYSTFDLTSESPMSGVPDGYGAPVYNSEIAELMEDYVRGANYIKVKTGEQVPDTHFYYTASEWVSGSIGSMFYYESGQCSRYYLQYAGTNVLNALSPDSTYRECTNASFAFDTIRSTPQVAYWMDDLDETQLSVNIGAYFETDDASISYNGQTISGIGDREMTVAFDADARIVVNGSIANPYVVLLDDTAPTIVDAYIEDVEPSSYAEDLRLTLEMNEALRPVNTLMDPDYDNTYDVDSYNDSKGDKSLPTPELTLTVEYGDVGAGVATGTFDVTLDEIDGKYMRFKLPDDINTYGEISIMKISNAEWEYDKGYGTTYYPIEAYGFDLWGILNNRLEGSANYFTDTENALYYMASAPIADYYWGDGNYFDIWSPYTDYAGNSFDISGQSLVAYDVIYDKTPPTVTGISMAGNMITADSTSAGDKTDWDEDIDLSAMYAGYGDYFALSIQFHEDIEIVSQIEIDFNFFEKTIDNTSIIYKLQGATGYQSSADTITSTNNLNEADSAANGFMFYIPYETYSIEEGPIRVYKVTGQVKDKAGNVLDLNTISVSTSEDDGDETTVSWADFTPAQQIYLDGTAPSVDVTEIDGVVDEDSIISYRFDFTDNQTLYNGVDGQYTSGGQGSGSVGKTFTLGLYAPSSYASPSAVPFYYYWSNSATAPSTATILSDGAQSTTYSKSTATTKFSLPITTDTMYLHLYFPDDTPVYLPGFCFSGYITDWAGNGGSLWGSAPSRTYIDTVDPVLSINSVTQTYNTGSNDTVESVTFTVNATAYDEGYSGFSYLDNVTLSSGDYSDSLDYQYYYNTTSYFKEKDYTITVPVGDIKNDTVVLTITATDSNENETILTRTETVNTDSFTADYTVGGDYSALTEGPSVVVNGSTEGDTRVTVVTDDGTYVRVIGKTETNVELFDFDDSWYKVTIENDEYTSVSARLTDTSELTDYYGPMTFTFDTNAGEDVSLTPSEGASIIPSGTTNHWTGEEFTINYAPIVDDVHSVAFATTMKDADGKSVSPTDGYYLINGTLAGSSVDITIANDLYEDWGISNVDFTQSYVELLDGDGKTVATMALVESATQTIVLPQYGDGTGTEGDDDYVAGSLLDTGVYQLKVTIVQKGVATSVTEESGTDDDGNTLYETYVTYGKGDVTEATMSTDIVYDNVQPTGGGLWGYSLNINDFASLGSGNEITKSYSATGSAYNTIMVNMKDSLYSNDGYDPWTAVSRDGQTSMYTGGAYQTELKLGITDVTQTLSAGDTTVTVGGVASVKVWNKLSPDTGITDTGIFEYGGLSYGTLKVGFENNSGEAYVVASADDLTTTNALLVYGQTNTVQMQFTMDNGAVSPVYEFTVMFTETTPQLAVTLGNVDYTTSGISSTTTEIFSADVTVSGGFSVGGDATLYRMTQSREDVIEFGTSETVTYKSLGVQSSYTTGLPYNYRVLSGDGYYTTTGDGFSACALAYLAVDAYGGTTLVAPEFKISAYTDGSYADYYLSYDRVNVENLLFTHSDANTAYYYEVSTTGITYGTLDLDASSITFAGEALDTPLTYTLSEIQTSNPVGYIGGYHYSYTGQFGFKIANPYGDEITADTATLNFVFTNGQESASTTVNLIDYANASTKTFDDSYAPYSIDGNTTNLVGSLDGKTIEEDLVFPIYESTSAQYTFYDATGALQSVTIDTTDNPEYVAIPIVEYSTTEPTTDAVTVTLTLASDNAGYFVYDGTTYKANDPCAITMTENGTIEVGYWAADNETYATKYYQFPITNIVSTSPTEYWNYAKNLNADGSIESIANQAIVTVYDSTWTLVDEIGDSLSYTFPLGSLKGDTYTFYYRVEEMPDMELQTYTVTLPYDVKDTTATLGDDEVFVEDTTVADTHAPSIQLLAYGKIGGTAFVNTQKLYKYEETSIVDILGEETAVSINPALTNYGDGYTTYSNSTEFVSALGWGSYYRFQVDATDNSSMKLIVKSSATVPTYDMESDVISGVSLTNTTLDVSANTSFYLYAVDSENNYTAVPMTFTSVGEAPVPQMVKEIVDGAVRVYLVPDEAGYTFTNLEITNESATTGTGDIGTYTDCTYISFATNGNYSISYTYDYLATADASGTLYVNVNELDNEAPVLGTITWSVNKDYSATNQQVTASLPFNETIAKVEASTLLSGYIETMISGSTVSVRYLQNYGAFTLRFYDASGNYTDETMPAVTNIDRVFTALSSAVTVNGTTATITFTFEETAICGKTGTAGTTLSYTVTADGEYTYTFYDVAGNSVSETVTVNHDNFVPLTLSYNTTNSDDGAVSASELELSVTETSAIYIKANRDCSYSFNGKTAVALTSGEWTALDIAIGDCSPFIYASDSLGYTVSDSLTGITANDSTAPDVSLVSSEISVSMGDSAATILALLKENLVATDNVTATSYLKANANITYTKPNTAGTVIATYTVKDEANNTAAAITCQLTFTADPIIILDGTAISRESTVMVSKDDEKNLSIYFNGEPFSLMYEAGIKTVAQVKIGSTDVIYNASEEQIITILDGADTGYYTFCAVTQSHDYFRFIVYVR